MNMKTIYADFNDLAADGALPLSCSGSRQSIANLGVGVSPGDRVWLTDGELWVEARLFLCGDGVWEARGEWKYRTEKPEGADEPTL
jgi:hypothetical protein